MTSIFFVQSGTSHAAAGLLRRSAPRDGPGCCSNRNEEHSSTNNRHLFTARPSVRHAAMARLFHFNDFAGRWADEFNAAVDWRRLQCRSSRAVQVCPNPRLLRNAWNAWPTDFLPITSGCTAGGAFSCSWSGLLGKWGVHRDPFEGTCVEGTC